MRVKSRDAVRWSLINAQRLHQRPCATLMGKPLEGRTVIVVGAGYSLVHNGQSLVQAYERGASVVCVNSSAPILRELGIRPDVLIVRESVDVSREIAESDAALVCVDLCAHPDAWTAAGERCAWFLAGYPRHYAIARMLGIKPTFGGSSAYTTAVHLAHEWGASRIVLVGADLGIVSDDDGVLRPYHPSSPRGTMRGTIDGDHILFSGNEVDEARSAAIGQKPQPARCRVHLVPSMDWTRELPILDTLLDQREWLQEHARRYPDVEHVNATADGAGIVGWTREDVDRVEIGNRNIPVFHASYIARSKVVELQHSLRGEVAHLGQQAANMLRAAGPRLSPLDSAGIVGAPLIECLAAHKLIDRPEDDPRAACQYTYEAFRDAAEEAGKLLTMEVPR